MKSIEEEENGSVIIHYDRLASVHIAANSNSNSFSHLSYADRELLFKIKYDNLFNIDKWYTDAFAPFTFPTQFLVLDVEEAESIVEHYQYHMRASKQSPSPAHVEILREFERKIERMIEGFSPHCVFVRLSARSPKDAGFGSTRMKELLRAELQTHTTGLQPGTPAYQNEEFKSFFLSQIKSLAVSRASEVIYLLTHSERIYDDLVRVLKLREWLPWDVKLAMRQWDPNSDLQYELRGFVYQRKLTALSQYYTGIFFPDLHQHHQRIVRDIARFFEQVRDVVPFDNYVMDFVWFAPTPASPRASVKCVEINPWGRVTSACLFDWTSDLSLLESTSSRIILRIIPHPLPVLRVTLPAASVQRIEIDPELLSEHSDLLSLVDDFMDDEFARINSNLRYVAQKKLQEQFFGAESDNSIEFVTNAEPISSSSGE